MEMPWDNEHAGLRRIVAHTTEILDKDPSEEWSGNDEEIEALRDVLETVQSIAVNTLLGFPQHEEEE